MTRSRFLTLAASLLAAPFAVRAIVAAPTTHIATVSAKDVADALARAGNAAKDAGVSFETLLAHVTRAQLATERGGAVIGNALKTVYTRAARLDVQWQLGNAGVPGLWMNKLGVTSDGDSVCRSVARVWPDLSAANQRVVAESLGGVYQVNVIRSIFTT